MNIILEMIADLLPIFFFIGVVCLVIVFWDKSQRRLKGKDKEFLEDMRIKKW